MNAGPDRVADSAGNWVDRSAPAAWRPYLRLARADRPIGSWLLLMPCLWSTAIAAIAGGTAPDWRLMALFSIGAVAMRGAGCTWNDYVDRDIDGLVERTRSRPIPSGAVTAKQALAFAIALSLVGFLVLIQLPPFAIMTGVASLGLIAIYPFMKRITWWPQIFLGLAFSWGALMGWAAVFSSIAAPAVVLYLAAILWTIGYDTIYALQDKDDDAMIGVHSTARLFGDRAAFYVGLFYAGAVAALVLVLVMIGAGPLAYVGLAAFAAHLGWQARRIDISDPARSLMLFRANRDAGLLLLAGLVADAYF